MFHGYGSNAQDLAGLVSSLSIPDTLFISLNAPVQIVEDSDCYQWFPIYHDETGIMDMDFSVCKNLITNLGKYIGNVLSYHNISADETALFGFSQGAFMALCLEMFLPTSFGATIAHSGLFYKYNNHELSKLGSLQLNKKHNILLLHGKKDDVLPFVHAERTIDFFRSVGISPDTHFEESLGHSVSISSLKKVQDFISRL